MEDVKSNKFAPLYTRNFWLTPSNLTTTTPLRTIWFTVVFPKLLSLNLRKRSRATSNDLDDTIVINDILNRYKTRKDILFRRLVNYVLISNARIFSASSVQKYLKGQQLECSLTTVVNNSRLKSQAFDLLSSLSRLNIRSVYNNP